MRALVNDEGEFNTQIAFIPKNGLKSDIHSIGYDGTGLKAITGHKSILDGAPLVAGRAPARFHILQAGRPEIYIRNLKSGAEKKVAAFEGMNLCGSFFTGQPEVIAYDEPRRQQRNLSAGHYSLALRRLTNNHAIDVSPAAGRRTGKKIAFVSDRSGSPQIYSMDADGSDVKRITYEGAYNSSPVWSPRGDDLAYEGQVGNRYQIFVIPAEAAMPGN